MFRCVIQHIQAEHRYYLAQDHGRNIAEAFETLYILRI
jgi:hypothetical protein